MVQIYICICTVHRTYKVSQNHTHTRIQSARIVTMHQTPCMAIYLKSSLPCKTACVHVLGQKHMFLVTPTCVWSEIERWRNG